MTLAEFLKLPLVHWALSHSHVGKIWVLLCRCLAKEGNMQNWCLCLPWILLSDPSALHYVFSTLLSLILTSNCSEKKMPQIIRMWANIEVSAVRKWHAWIHLQYIVAANHSLTIFTHVLAQPTSMLHLIVQMGVSICKFIWYKLQPKERSKW